MTADPSAALAAIRAREQERLPAACKGAHARDDVRRMADALAAVLALCDEARWTRRGTYAAGQRYALGLVRAVIDRHAPGTTTED